MKVTAAVKYKDRDGFVVQDVELEAPRDDEILVRIAGVGLCHTDLVAAAGAFDQPGQPYPFPAVFGHEGSGIVEAVGSDVTAVAPGDRVAVTVPCCGECDRCQDGKSPYCRSAFPMSFSGKRLADGSTALSSCRSSDGGDTTAIASNFLGQSSFASHAITYENNVVKVPEDVPLELMGPLGCSVQTGVGGVIHSLDAKPGSSILITGGGPVGLSAVMGAKIRGCGTIILLEPIEDRRQLGKELGATHVLDPGTSTTLADAVREIVPGGVDYAFYACGIPSVLCEVVNCMGSKGIFTIAGVPPPGTPPPGDLLQLISLGLTLKGIVVGDSDPKAFIPELIQNYKAGRLPFDKMIQTYPLSRINEAIADQHDGKCCKVVLIPE